MKKIRFRSGRLYRRGIQEIGSRLYINPAPDVDKSILVAGAARSGTTWLGDLIASQIPCRILFEPFNPNLVAEYRGFHYFQYLRPGADNPGFDVFAQKVFTGQIRNRWIDHQNQRIFSRYRLIKEIRANLALRWLHEHFPQVPIIFTIRHPCAVVASRMELDWATDDDIKSFLLQRELISDHLAPYMDLIKRVQTPEEKHAVIWCVSNLVPLRQFGPGELQLVYYEKLCLEPKTQLPVLFQSIGHRYETLLASHTSRPSQTARPTSAVVTGTDKLSSWRRRLTPGQIEKILRVVEAFGLDHLYGDSLSPLDANAI